MVGTATTRAAVPGVLVCSVCSWLAHDNAVFKDRNDEGNRYSEMESCDLGPVIIAGNVLAARIAEYAGSPRVHRTTTSAPSLRRMNLARNPLFWVSLSASETSESVRSLAPAICSITSGDSATCMKVDQGLPSSVKRVFRTKAATRIKTTTM